MLRCVPALLMVERKRTELRGESILRTGVFPLGANPRQRGFSALSHTAMASGRCSFARVIGS